MPCRPHVAQAKANQADPEVAAVSLESAESKDVVCFRWNSVWLHLLEGGGEGCLGIWKPLASLFGTVGLKGMRIARSQPKTPASFRANNTNLQGSAVALCYCEKAEVLRNKTLMTWKELRKSDRAANANNSSPVTELKLCNPAQQRPSNSMLCLQRYLAARQCSPQWNASGFERSVVQKI